MADKEISREELSQRRTVANLLTQLFDLRPSEAQAWLDKIEADAKRK